MNMLQWIIEVLGIACAVSIVMSQSKLYAWFVNKVKGVKPFSCELCMAFWSYLIYAIPQYEFSVEMVFSAFICGFVGFYTSSKFLKW